MVTIRQGDCIELMQDIPNASVDFILADPPYGTTQCAWDVLIPFEPMWEHLKRIIKPKGVIALFCAEPFGSALRMSNIKNYKYEWIWDKGISTGFLNAKKRPLKVFENIAIFSYGTPVYYPIMETRGRPIKKRSGCAEKGETVYGKFNSVNAFNNVYYPKDILYFPSTREGHHRTQKPTSILEYLIRTYTQPGQTVLDFTMGSGSTGVACVSTGRDFIGIEKDGDIFNTAQERIKKAQEDMAVHLFIPV